MVLNAVLNLKAMMPPCFSSQNQSCENTQLKNTNKIDLNIIYEFIVRLTVLRTIQTTMTIKFYCYHRVNDALNQSCFILPDAKLNWIEEPETSGGNLTL